MRSDGNTPTAKKNDMSVRKHTRASSFGTEKKDMLSDLCFILVEVAAAMAAIATATEAGRTAQEHFAAAWPASPAPAEPHLLSTPCSVLEMTGQKARHDV